MTLSPEPRLLARIVLPFPLPTWNRLLAMHHWQRKKLRDLLDRCASSFVQSSSDYAMPMVLRPSTSWIASCLPDYLRLIRPKSLKKSRIGKKKPKRKKR